MCGRYSLATSKEKIAESFGINIEADQLTISFNIAPTHKSYVITNQDPNELSLLNWGIIPSWSKDGSLNGKLINARIEGISSKPSFRMALRKRRCLIIADSFYEWRKEGSRKIPYRILPINEELLCFAGIWEEWGTGPEKKRTFSILTTDANEDLNTLHNRMPLYFKNKDDQALWISDLKLDEINEMMRIPTPGYLRMYRVSEQLNLPVNNFHQIHQEIPEPPSLFG